MGCKWNPINYLDIKRNLEYLFWRLRRRVNSLKYIFGIYTDLKDEVDHVLCSRYASEKYQQGHFG